MKLESIRTTDGRNEKRDLLEALRRAIQPQIVAFRDRCSRAAKHFHGWDEARLRQHWRVIAGFDGAATDLSDLMANKCFEKFDAFVPPALLNAANERDRLDVPGARALAAQC